MRTRNPDYLKDNFQLNETANKRGIKTNQLWKVYHQECDFWQKQYEDYFGIESINDDPNGFINSLDDPVGYHIATNLEQALVRANRYFEQLNPQVLENA